MNSILFALFFPIWKEFPIIFPSGTIGPSYQFLLDISVFSRVLRSTLFRTIVSRPRMISAIARTVLCANLSRKRFRTSRDAAFRATIVPLADDSGNAPDDEPRWTTFRRPFSRLPRLIQLHLLKLTSLHLVSYITVLPYDCINFIGDILRMPRYKFLVDIKEFYCTMSKV